MKTAHEVNRNGRGTGGRGRAGAIRSRIKEYIQESDETARSENARVPLA